MDPTAERVLISVGSIGKDIQLSVELYPMAETNIGNRSFHSGLFYCLDGLADYEKVENDRAQR